MNKKSYLLPVVALLVFFSSCVKKEVVDLGSEGNTYIKITDPKNNAIFFSPFSDIKKVPLFNLVRDANTNANLQKVSDITIVSVPGLVTRYNAANGSNFEQLPDSLYTLDPSVTKSGSTYTVTLKAGEFSINFPILLNGAKWDLSRKYALGFALNNPGQGNVISNGKDSVIALVSIKNAYDGRYRYEMCTYHPVGNPTYACGETEVQLHTVSSDASAVYWPDAGGYAGPMIYGGGPSYFGSQCPVYTVNPATNKVSVSNNCGSLAYTTVTAAAPTPFDTRYVPATRKFFVRYGYNYDPGPVFNPANNREWTLELTYLGPR